MRLSRIIIEMAKPSSLQFVFWFLFVCLASSTAYLYLDNQSLRKQLVEEGWDMVAAIEQKAEEKTSVTVAEEKAAGSGTSETPRVAEQAEQPEKRPSRAERQRKQIEAFISRFDDPEQRMALVDRNLRDVDRRYGKFFQRLDLEPDDIEALRVLLAERGVVRLEERMKRRFYGDEDLLENAMAKIESEKTSIEASIGGVLGEEGSEKFESYMQEQPYRARVERLENSLSYTKAPMTAKQSEQLSSAYAHVGQEFEYTIDFSDRDNFRKQLIDRDSVETFALEMETFDSLVLAQASSVLSDDQLTNLAEQQIMDRNEMTRRLENQIDSPGEGRGGFGGRVRR